MVTVKGTNIGLEGGVFKDSLAKLQQQVRAESRFSSLGNDDAFSSNTLAALRSDSGNSAFSDRISNIAGLNNDIESLRNGQRQEEAVNRLNNELTELQAAAEAGADTGLIAEQFGQVTSQLEGLGVDTSNIEVPTETSRGNTRGSSRRGGESGPDLPDNFDDLNTEELSDLRNDVANRQQGIDEELGANIRENDSIRDRTNALNEELEQTTDEDRRAEINEELGSLAEQSAANGERFDELSTARERTTATLGAIDERIEELGGTVDPGNGDRASELRAELRRNENRLGDLSEQNEDLNERITGANEELVQIENDLAAARENPDLLSDEDRDALIERRTALTEEIGGLNTERRELEGAISERQEEITALQEREAELQEQVLTDDEREEIEGNIARLEEEIAPLAERSDALGRLLERVGEGRAEIGERLTAIEERIEGGASGRELRSLRRERAGLRVADRVLEESENFLTRRRGRIEDQIAGEREQIQAGRDRIAASDAAQEEIAAGQERQAVLNEEIAGQEEQLGAVNERLTERNEALERVNEPIDADTAARQAIVDLEDRQSSVTEGRDNDVAQIAANDEEAAALQERNAQIQAELDALAGDGLTPEERQQEIDRLTTRQGEINERLGTLEEENEVLAEQESEIQGRVDSAQNTIDNTRTFEQLDADETANADELEALIDEDDEARTGFLNFGLREIRDLEDAAQRFRDEGRDFLADIAQGSANIIREGIARFGSEEERGRLNRFDELNSEQDAIEGERTRRTNAEASLSTAQEELGAVQESRANNAQEQSDLEAERAENAEALQRLRAAQEVEGPEPSNPAEARAELEERLRELEARQDPNAERDAALGEEDAELAELEGTAQERVDNAQATLDGLRSNEELDDAEASLNQEREELIDEAPGIRLIARNRDLAASLREEGDERGARRAERRAEIVERVIRRFGDEEANARLDRFNEIDEELAGVESERGQRVTAEVELNEAQGELERVQGQRSDIAEERGRLAELAESDEQEIGSIRDALREGLPVPEDQRVDTEQDLEGLSEDDRRELAVQAVDELEVNNGRLDEIEVRLNELDEEEADVRDQISSLTGRRDSEGLTESEQEELEELENRLESVANRRELFGEQRGELESRNSELVTFVDRTREGEVDPEDPGDPPTPEEPPVVGGGREQLVNELAGFRAAVEEEGTRLAAANRTLSDSITSRIDQRSREVTIDIFEGQASAVGDADADSLARGIADQIRNLASQGQGQNAVSAAFADSTDTGRLTDRLRQLFA